MATETLARKPVVIPQSFQWQRAAKWVVALVLVLFFYWSAQAVEFSLARLNEGKGYMWEFLQRMFPPDWKILGRVFNETLLTIQLAWVSTCIAAVLSVPCGFIAASNMHDNTWLRRIVIFVLNADRAIDSLILALFFVSAVGLGPFPGTLALAIHSVGMLGKLFADAIEAIDPGPVEALRSAGAGRLATIRWGVWPQVAPHFISFFLFRFELNVRVAVVLGLVGAGGIGFLLTQYMRLFQYPRVCTVILVILVLVMVVDYFSSKLRRSVL
jgi:phosphonate transport system permease protein